MMTNNQTIEWDDRQNLNISTIDRQHQHFITLFNTLYQSVLNNTSSKTQLSIIDQLLDHCIFHFLTEKNMMLQTHYPEYAGHQLLHDNFYDEVKNLKIIVDTKDVTMITTLIHILLKWLINHIEQSDRIFVEWYVDHQMSGKESA